MAGARRSDLGARIVVAIPALIIAGLLVGAGGTVFAAGLIALGVICLHELFALLAPWRPLRLAGFIGLAALVLAAHYGDQFQVVLVAAAIVPLVFAFAVAAPVREGITLSIAATLLGVWWIGLAVAHATLLRDVTLATGDGRVLDVGFGLVIDVLVGTFVGDTGAYLGGRAFGRRPLAPRISPHKTFEGLLCGIAAGIAGVWVAGLYQDWLKGWQALVLGASVALAAPVGDLFESLVKRDAGVKDTGRLFGVHGGALDRLDAVLFGIVAGYYAAVAML